MSSLTAPLALFNADLYTSSSTQQHDLGALGQTVDGRRFRYVKAGGTSLVVGKLQQAIAEDTGEQNLTPTATSAGATSLTTSTTVTVTANQYQGGFVVVTVDPGVGYMYKILSHPAATGAAVTLSLEDKIQVALTTTSRIDLVQNPFNGVVVNPTTATSSPLGVAVYPITNAQFGWIQVGGPAVCLADGTVTVGTSVDASNGTAGAVEAHVEAGVQAPVGYAMTGIATTEYGTIFLTIN